MIQTLTSIIKWTTIPVLMVASVFSSLAAGYESLVDVVICMAAIVFIHRAAKLHQYVSGAGFIAIVVMFSPLFLIVKIFLLLGLTCMAAFAALLAAFRLRPLPVV